MLGDFLKSFRLSSFRPPPFAFSLRVLHKFSSHAACRRTFVFAKAAEHFQPPIDIDICGLRFLFSSHGTPPASPFQERLRSQSELRASMKI